MRWIKKVVVSVSKRGCSEFSRRWCAEWAHASGRSPTLPWGIRRFRSSVAGQTSARPADALPSNYLLFLLLRSSTAPGRAPVSPRLPRRRCARRRSNEKFASCRRRRARRPRRRCYFGRSRRSSTRSKLGLSAKYSTLCRARRSQSCSPLLTTEPEHSCSLSRPRARGAQ